MSPIRRALLPLVLAVSLVLPAVPALGRTGAARSPAFRPSHQASATSGSVLDVARTWLEDLRIAASWWFGMGSHAKSSTASPNLGLGADPNGRLAFPSGAQSVAPPPANLGCTADPDGRSLCASGAQSPPPTSNLGCTADPSGLHCA